MPPRLSAGLSQPSTPSAFYPSTCHPALDRRRFLAGGAALAACALLQPGPAGAASDGSGILRLHAGLASDPWAVAHGIRGMGRAFAMQDGSPAVEFLLGRVLEMVPAGATRVLGFPPAAEVHQDSFLKSMLEAGVPLDHAFSHGGRRHTLRDVLDGARALFRPSALREPNALPWSLIAFTRTTPRAKSTWTNAWGEAVDLDAAVEAGLDLLERASAPLEPAMREGRMPDGPAPVNGFTCGGTHMLYALTTAAHHGYATGERLERVKRQMDLLVWRLEVEPVLIDRFYGARSTVPGAEWYAKSARLKFLGHAEECLALATRRRVVALSAKQQARRRASVAALRELLVDLEGRDLGLAHAVNRELYRQIVGDVGHARHGLTLT